MMNGDSSNDLAFLPTKVVNLKSRPDRLQEFKDHLIESQLPLNYSVFPGVQGSIAADKAVNARIGCTLSHRHLIAEAKEEGLPRVLLLEDDVSFTAQTQEILLKYQKFIESQDWDLLYLGINAQGPLLQVDEGLHRVTKALSVHAVLINQRAYDVFLNHWPATQNQALTFTRRYKISDVYLSEYVCPRLETFAFIPMLATQRPSQSDICDGIADYDELFASSLKRITQRKWVWSLA